MNTFKIFFIAIVFFSSCKPNTKEPDKIETKTTESSDFILAFGSCNNQVLSNTFWPEILKNKPNVWVWGGDIIYSDTENMSYLKENYEIQKNNEAYKLFAKSVPIMATWDDHDYGMNDGGTEYEKKDESQQLFLDFLDCDSSDVRRNQKGVYYAKDFNVNNSIIKIIILDTRYFRTPLTPNTNSKKRYQPNKYGEGTMLGEIQWNWLKNELKNSKAEFNVIMSSIQFLSNEHGFEMWGNMPHEVAKLEDLLKETHAKNTIILSGDRHISEISKKNIDSLAYPLIDFTSSGLTHSYTNFKSEPNQYRVGNVVSKKSFGILKFNLKTKQVTMEMRGDNNVLFETYTQNYN